MKLITNAIATNKYFFLWDILPHLPISIGIFILQVLSLHNHEVKLTCDNFNKYGSNLNSFLNRP